MGCRYLAHTLLVLEVSAAASAKSRKVLPWQAPEPMIVLPSHRQRIV